MQKTHTKEQNKDYDIQALFEQLSAKDGEELDDYFSPNLAVTDVLRVILYKFFLLVDFYKERIVLFDNAEDLHQFRVNIRKSRAFLKEFDFLQYDLQLGSISDTLGAFAKQTNHKRDLDVMQTQLASLVDGQYDTISARIMQEQKEEHIHIQNLLTSQRVEAFFTDYRAALIHNTLLDGTCNTMHTKALIKKVVTKLHQKIIKKITRLEKNFSVEKLHTIRITLKRFRYLLEEFQVILGKKEVETVIKNGKMLQALLGDYNDSITQEQLLQPYLDDVLLYKLYEYQKETLETIMKKLHHFKKEDFTL